MDGKEKAGVEGEVIAFAVWRGALAAKMNMFGDLETAIPIAAADLKPLDIHAIFTFYLSADPPKGLLNAGRKKSIFLLVAQVIAA